MKRLLFSLCVLPFAVTNALATDPLLLSEAEMQKLHAYFPAEDESAPLIWKGDPLSIALPINAEKRIVFPEPIEANLNSALSSDQLRIINNDQSLYLTALKPFNTTRLYVTLKISNKILLLDISTSDKATRVMRAIKLASNSLPSNTPTSTQKTSSTVVQTLPTSAMADSNVQDNFGSANNYVNAIRFAWQQLYAPQRLLNKNTDFARTPMHTTQWVSDLVYGDKVLAHPEVSWVAGDLYVTAVELRNKYPHPTTIHLQHDLCGEWQAATLYPRAQLKPAGNKTGDSTTLFLISTKPFGDMLEVCHGGA